MTNWCPIHVPFQERRLVRALGCTWDARLQQWGCTSTQYRHKSFKRYRTRQFGTARVFVSFNEIQHAKLLGCRWVPQSKWWVYDVPDDDALVEPWIAARLEPPEMAYFRVPFDQRDVAKSAGAQFDRERKLWCLPTRGQPHPPQRQTRPLDLAEDPPRVPGLDGVGLDDRKGAFDAHFSSPWCGPVGRAGASKPGTWGGSARLEWAG